MKKQSCLRSNQGAAMITVVIAILFILALGVALLSTSYMGYTVALAQKHDKAAFFPPKRKWTFSAPVSTTPCPTPSPPPTPKHW